MNTTFKKFFYEYAKNVDNANKQAFWALSDALILEILKKHIPKDLTKKNCYFRCWRRNCPLGDNFTQNI